MRGVLNVNKPAGISSYDVIRRLRRVIGRMGPIPIGHAGTLDPLASGVLLVLLGEATKLSRFFLSSPKEYEAEVLLGVQTDTDDTAGRTIASSPVPELDPPSLARLLERFRGEQEQVPPRFSALKQEGRPLYRRARAGEDFEVRPRRVTVHEIEPLGWEPPRLTLRLVVSSGTYVRALARDIGLAAASVATLARLVRTRSGRFRLEGALELEQADPETVAAHLVPIPDALPELPRITVDEREAALLGNGRALRRPLDITADYAFAATPDSRFLALVRPAAETIRPARIIYADA